MASRYRTIETLLCAVCRVADAEIWRPGMVPACSAFCKRRAINLKSHYGLTPEAFWKLWDEQDGRCAMPGCRREFVFDASPVRRWQHVQVDHDSVTGRVRGLLCATCNRNLGGYEKVIELGAATYLSDA